MCQGWPGSGKPITTVHVSSFDVHQHQSLSITLIKDLLYMVCMYVCTLLNLSFDSSVCEFLSHVFFSIVAIPDHVCINLPSVLV